MNVIKIAWRSIQHRGFGSLLTVVSMALGVMMVVAVLSIHGLVSKSFKSNNSFGYNIIVGARGGGLQLTLNSVYYLSKPVENVPYEYYLAFCDKELRERDLKHSIAFQNRTNVEDTSDFTAAFSPFGGLASALSNAILDDHIASQQDNAMGLGKPGIYKKYTHMAVPICLGDYYVDPETEAAFRGVATSPNFFTDLVLDIETEEKFEFAKGRNFERESIENGFFECVVGSVVAKRCDIQVGDRLQATHGDPNDDDSHLHEQNFVVTGILKGTNTPNDRIVFFNMEGFFLIEDHVKPVESNSVLKSGNDDPDSDSKDDEKKSAMPIVDPFADEELDGEESVSDNKDPVKSTNDQNVVEKLGAAKSVDEIVEVNDQRIALPIEQREVTSILVRTSLDDEFDVLTMFLPPLINDGDIETTLDWTPFRPERAQKAAQAVNPVQEVASLFSVFVDPVRWLLLALTCMICIVSAISILVGIYNSMNQRRHEIAVMRALGANRTQVMAIMLCEAILLALLGCGLGWLAGHGLNAAISPIVEIRTGVPISFFDFAPSIPIGIFFGGALPDSLASIGVSPEFLIIPGMMMLAVLVGIYPAISAYRTDVSQSLGK